MSAADSLLANPTDFDLAEGVAVLERTASTLRRAQLSCAIAKEYPAALV